MKTVVLVAALLFFPMVIVVTLAAMMYAKRREAIRPQGFRELLIVGGILVAIAIGVPLLLLVRAFP